MQNTITIQLRAFPVVLMDRCSGKSKDDKIVVSKAQLQAAQIIGQSNKELIIRLCGKQGWQVVEIGKPERRELVLDLAAEYKKRWSNGQ